MAVIPLAFDLNFIMKDLRVVAGRRALQVGSWAAVGRSATACTIEI